MSDMETDNPVPASSPPDSQFLANGASTGTSAANGTTNGTANAIAGPSSTQNASGSGAAQAGETPDLAALFAQRREEELAKRDKSLAEFLVMLDGYKPLVSWLCTCCRAKERVCLRKAD